MLIASVVVLAIIVLFLARNGEKLGRILQRILSPSSIGLANKTAEIMNAFGNDLNMIRDAKSLTQILILSISIWLLVGLAYLETIHAFNSLWRMSLGDALLLMGFSLVGSVVQLPGGDPAIDRNRGAGARFRSFGRAGCKLQHSRMARDLYGSRSAGTGLAEARTLVATRTPAKQRNPRRSVRITVRSIFPRHLGYSRESNRRTLPEGWTTREECAHLASPFPGVKSASARHLCSAGCSLKVLGNRCY